MQYVYVCLQAYDQHLNMILGEVEETITTVEIDDETYEEIIKVCRATCGATFCTTCCTICFTTMMCHMLYHMITAMACRSCAT